MKLFCLVAFSYIFCLLNFTYADQDVVPSREMDLLTVREMVTSEEGRKTLEDEYMSIQGGKRHDSNIGEEPGNLKKNRYEELAAFDDTRVILQPPTNPELVPDATDYINANYIDGYYREREYAATQGPLPNTEVDFWRMVWQLNSTKIIMLANLFEHGKPKVHKYWPDSEHRYGEISVVKIAEHEMEDIHHVLRVFKILKDGYVRPRIVRHFHFTGWPDLGVPDERMPIVALLKQARSYNPQSTAPIVVHCSAGVGRTGTVILTDSMIQRAKGDGVVDFPKRLDSMRKQRVDVVEKKEQYLFAHEAVNDLYNNKTSARYLKKVAREYEDWEYEKFVKDLQAPGEFPALYKMMDHHVSEMRKVMNQIHDEYRKDIDFHVAYAPSPAAGA